MARGGMDNDLPYVEELRRAYSLPGADDRLSHDIIGGPHHSGHGHLEEDFEKTGTGI